MTTGMPAAIQASASAMLVKRATWASRPLLAARTARRPDVVDYVVASAGPHAAEARPASEAGGLRSVVRAAAVMAGSLGVRATPTWLIGRRVLVPGVVPRDRLDELVSRLTGSDTRP